MGRRQVPRTPHATRSTFPHRGGQAICFYGVPPSQDAMSGAYKRGSNHIGPRHKNDKAAGEVETVVTVPNRPND